MFAMSSPYERSCRTNGWPKCSTWQVFLVFMPACLQADGARVRPHANRDLLAPLNRTGPQALRLHWMRSLQLECGIGIHVDGRSDRAQSCPDACPLWAELRGDGYCDFKCVPDRAADCMAVSPHAPIPDKKMGICRSCLVSGCWHCASDGTDTCAECSSGYRLVDGQCLSRTRYALWATLGVLGLALALLAWWVVNLFCRRGCNEEGLKRGLATRSRAKLHMPAGAEDETSVERRSTARRRRWPLTSNLLKENVAGPGLTAYFSFQLVVILWAALVSGAWLLLSLLFDEQLLSVGTDEAMTPRGSCVVVGAGYETQHRLMWVKVRFLFAVYVASFLLAIAFSVWQLRSFEGRDAEETTHKDFCAICRGLPQLPGSDRAEQELQSLWQDFSGQEVVGVSVCWDFKEQMWDVMGCVEAELRILDPSMTPRWSTRGSPSPREGAQGWQQKLFGAAERSFFSPPVQRFITKGRSGGQQDLRGANLSRQHGSLTAAEERDFEDWNLDVQKILHGLRSSDTAFVVFQTEAARDAAVAAAKEGKGPEFRGCRLTLQAAGVEPSSFTWQNFMFPSLRTQVWRVFVGIGGLFLALLVWVGVFYFPYALYAVSYNYKYGMEPHVVSNLLFSMIVVVGNAVMYAVCGEIANYISFRSVDAREVCYMMLYTFACVTNVILDLVITYYVAYSMMVGIDMHTYDGRRLADVRTFMERFETFAMQRELGESVAAYAFPSTFLIPFIVEPLATIFAPYMISRLIVVSNTNFQGAYAESVLMSPNMDLSRYGDVLLNVILAVLIFFFPGGYTAPIFLALVVSHLWIYAYDHFRVLRCVQTFQFASLRVDWWAQWMLAWPCGMLLACALLKSNCQDPRHCVGGTRLIARCLFALLLHVALHTLALLYLVPKFGLKPREPAGTSYRQCGERLPFSWFNTNPVHCLRSKHVYEHEPSCDFCIAGKEHLMRVNHDIGQHFQDDAVCVEDYSMSVRHLSNEFRYQLKQSWRIFSPHGTRRCSLESEGEPSG